jgi:hypothetical protein
MSDFGDLQLEFLKRVKTILNYSVLTTRVVETFSWEQYLGIFESQPDAQLPLPICYLTFNASGEESQFSEVMEYSSEVFDIKLYLIMSSKQEMEFNPSITTTGTTTANATLGTVTNNPFFELNEVFSSGTESYRLTAWNNGTKIGTFDKALPATNVKLRSELKQTLYRVLGKLRTNLINDPCLSNLIQLNSQMPIDITGQDLLNKALVGTRSTLYSGVLECKATVLY